MEKVDWPLLLAAMAITRRTTTAAATAIPVRGTIRKSGISIRWMRLCGLLGFLWGNGYVNHDA